MDWTSIGIKCVKESLKALEKVKKVKIVKDQANVQTNADIVANNAFIKSLKSEKISGLVYSEEEEGLIILGNGDEKTKIVLDPLDNTHLYLRGEKLFCSVVMMVIIGNHPAYAFVGDVVTGDIYHCDFKKAYKNNEVIKIPSKTVGKKIILGWAPYLLRLKRFYKGMKKLAAEGYYVYNYGGQLQTVKIATGNYDAYVEVRAETLNEFSGALIVQRAGGIISRLDGKPLSWDPKKKQTLVVARNKEIWQTIVNQFKNNNFED